MKKDLTQEKIPVWVVDDDEVRYSIRFALATHGIDARTYASGEDFFNLVETDQPGCLVVDLTMPGMSGIEVLKRLRDLDSPIKVIVLSGHGTIRTAVEAMENGAISFMEKPVDPDDLLVKINAARDASLLEVCKTRVRHMLRQFSKRETQIFDLVCQGLKNGEIAGAGLDVLVEEPFPADHPFMTMPNVVLTPHMAAQSQETVSKLVTMAAEGTLAVLRGEKWPYVANPEVYDHPRWKQ